MNIDTRSSEYFRSKVRVIDLLRVSSKVAGVDIDAIVIDAGRDPRDQRAHHIIKLIVDGRDEVVEIGHEAFMDVGRLAQVVAPLFRNALLRVAQTTQ